MLPSGDGNPFLHATVGDMLAAMAARAATREAIVATDRRITYAQLHREAQRVARGLLAHGVKRNDKVALWLPTRPEWLVRPVRLRDDRRGGGGAQHALQGPRAALHPAPVGRHDPRLRRPRGAGGLSGDPRRGAPGPGRVRAGRDPGRGLPAAPSRDRGRGRSLRGMPAPPRRGPRRGRARVGGRPRRRGEGGGPGRSVHDPLHVRDHVVPEGRDHQPSQLPAARLVVRRGHAPDSRRSRPARPPALGHLGRPLHPPGRPQPRRRPDPDGDVRARGGAPAHGGASA